MTLSVSAQENIIGTKWIASGAVLINRDTIEFVNNSYCLYTSLKRSELLAYQVKGNRIILGDIASFVIKGNTLFIGRYPYFIRE